LDNKVSSNDPSVNLGGFAPAAEPIRLRQEMQSRERVRPDRIKIGLR
jgi:hypothetical protein